MSAMTGLISLTTPGRCEPSAPPRGSCNVKSSCAIAMLTALGMAWPACGHHSDVGYDRETVVAFEAHVSRYVFRNPHVTIVVETEDRRGGNVEWEIETGSTPIMQRSGWSQDLLRPGDTVTVRAHPERTGRMRAILSTLETADGRLWSQIETDAESTVSASSLAGAWKGVASTGVSGQFSQVELTPAAKAARANYDELTDDPNARCIADPTPFRISNSNYLTGIEILADRVMLRNEFLDVNRTVYTDGRGHPEIGERTIQGHSIGWWEDDVLVVDTTLFADFGSGNGAGVPSGSQKHAVERYSLSEDGTRAIVDIFVEDPEFLAEPFIGRTEMVYVPHLQLYRYDCILD